jgi:peptide/nickel transport system permease protein
LIWAFPVLLLAIALGTALSINGFHTLGINIEGGSLWIPTLVIAFVSIPYSRRPLRGQILSLREKEFIEARRRRARARSGHVRRAPAEHRVVGCSSSSR